MKSNIYTRTGDGGETSLVDGSRTGKDNPRVEAYGDIDELSSALGLVIADKECPGEIKDELQHVQQLLFTVGGYLATPVTDGKKVTLEKLQGENEKLEGWIDAIDERLPKLNSFILPGGGEASCRCHLARTICRRAERQIISLSRENPVDPQLIAYINRLSDYLFVVSRYLNFIQGIEEVSWKP